MDVDIENITAFNIIKEILDHSWDLSEFPSDGAMYSAMAFFKKMGGSWEKLMSGDANMISILENAMEAAFVDNISIDSVDKVSKV
jgi:hypothetical protein